MTYKWIDEDQSLVNRAVEELDQYLSSEVLLWRIAGLKIPLTPGNLLLSFQRLMAVKNPNSIQCQNALLKLMETRRSAWLKKVSQELPMRVYQWQECVEEITRYGSLDASYQYSVRVRVIIALLTADAKLIDNELQMKVETSDKRLFMITKPGEFIWDTELGIVFAPEIFPYLYLQTGDQA